jgi:6-phosphogluconolactonase
MLLNLVYVGTYTRSGRSAGIHLLRQDPTNGSLTPVQVTDEIDPSWLGFDPSRRFLFATSEGLGDDGGVVASFGIDDHTGELTLLSRQPTHGGEPCHLCTDPSGRWLLVANHENGTVAVLPIDASGRLGAATDVRQHVGSGPGPTQQGPHAHHVTFDPTGQRVLVADKGIDQVVIYTLDTSAGKLIPSAPAFARLHPGAAPRHLAFHPNGRFVYVNGEADMTLTAFAYDGQRGVLRELQVVPTLPDGASGEKLSTAEVLVEPSGHWVYVSNRGHDSIADFAIDLHSGRLTPAGHVATQGRTPRHFALDASGTRMYVANQESDSIVQFRIDQQSGQPVPTGDVTRVGAPVCVLFG